MAEVEDVDYYINKVLEELIQTETNENEINYHVQILITTYQKEGVMRLIKNLTQRFDNIEQKNQIIDMFLGYLNDYNLQFVKECCTNKKRKREGKEEEEEEEEEEDSINLVKARKGILRPSDVAPLEKNSLFYKQFGEFADSIHRYGVEGDGTCFFHSVLASEPPNIPQEFQNYRKKNINEKKKIGQNFRMHIAEIANDNSSSNDKLANYVAMVKYDLGMPEEITELYDIGAYVGDVAWNIIDILYGIKVIVLRQLDDQILQCEGINMWDDKDPIMVIFNVQDQHYETVVLLDEEGRVQQSIFYKNDPFILKIRELCQAQVDRKFKKITPTIPIFTKGELVEEIRKFIKMYGFESPKSTDSKYKYWYQMKKDDIEEIYTNMLLDVKEILGEDSSSNSKSSEEEEEEINPKMLDCLNGEEEFLRELVAGMGIDIDNDVDKETLCQILIQTGVL